MRTCIGIMLVLVLRLASPPQTLHAGETPKSLDTIGSGRIYTGFPFDPQEAKRRQQETAKILDVPVEKTVTLPGGFKMVFMLIPAGEYLMGSSESAEEVAKKGGERLEWLRPEHPRGQVRITKPFYLAKFECTQGQWKSVTGKSPSLFKGDDSLPVENVSWSDIQERFLPQIQKFAPAGMQFRLPTEAEWEYACRAGTATPFHFGETITTAQANYDGTRSYGNAPAGEHRLTTTAVGSFPPNAWGLHDMHGNVSEWVQDYYEMDYYERRPTDNPANTQERTLVLKANRVIRGGCWASPAGLCRSAMRIPNTPDSQTFSYGFRLALDLPLDAVLK